MRLTPALFSAILELWLPLWAFRTPSFQPQLQDRGGWGGG
jgi:hypothetical protein